MYAHGLGTRHNDDYIHHKKSTVREYISEVVFGAQDGMVSTLGAITGIAVGSQEYGVVILSGVAIIAVESISMAIGAYVGTISERNVIKRILYEEKQEIREFPKEEKIDLYRRYIADGWPEDLAHRMAQVASESEALMLHEMAHHELSIIPDGRSFPLGSALAMFVAYVAGGIIPLFSYFLFPVKTAIPLSIVSTFTALFILGALLTLLTKQPIIRSGMRMLLLGGIALAVGLLVGVFVPQAL